MTNWPSRIEPFLVRGREFTDEQLDQVDAFMAGRVGAGAVEPEGPIDVVQKLRASLARTRQSRG